MPVLDRARDQQRRTTLIKSILTVAFVVVAVTYIGTRASEFRSLAWPSPSAIGMVAIGFVASVYFRSLYNYFVARRLGSSLSLLESFMLSAVVTASNAVLPANPGATFRAVYMKKVHSFPYAYFASSTALSFLITTLMMSVIGMALLLLINFELGYFRLDLFIALPIITIVAGFGLLLRGKVSADRRSSIWTTFKSSYLELVTEHRLIYLSIAIVAANFAVASFVWLVVLREYAADITTLEGLLFAASQIVSGLINLTPGAAGFQELVGMYVGQSFELSSIELFAILIWVRLVRVVAAVALGIPCAIALQVRSH